MVWRVAIALVAAVEIVLASAAEIARVAVETDRASQATDRERAEQGIDFPAPAAIAPALVQGAVALANDFRVAATVVLAAAEIAQSLVAAAIAPAD